MKSPFKYLIAAAALIIIFIAAVSGGKDIKSDEKVTVNTASRTPLASSSPPDYPSEETSAFSSPIAVALSSPTAEPTPVPLCNISISYTAKRVSNNHVGNNWEYSLYANDKKVKKSCSFDIEENAVLLLECRVTENDSIPDEGYSIVSIDMSSLKEGKNKLIEDVIVTENRGRYSGNDAKWTFTITITKKVIR